MANPNRLTAQQCVEVLKEETGDEIKPVTFHSYVNRGHAPPKPVEKIGNTPPVEAQRDRRMGPQPARTRRAHRPTQATPAHPPTKDAAE